MAKRTMTFEEMTAYCSDNHCLPWRAWWYVVALWRFALVFAASYVAIGFACAYL